MGCAGGSAYCGCASQPAHITDRALCAAGASASVAVTERCGTAGAVLWARRRAAQGAHSLPSACPPHASPRLSRPHVHMMADCGRVVAGKGRQQAGRDPLDLLDGPGQFGRRGLRLRRRSGLPRMCVAASCRHACLCGPLRGPAVGRTASAHFWTFCFCMCPLHTLLMRLCECVVRVARLWAVALCCARPLCSLCSWSRARGTA